MIVTVNLTDFSAPKLYHSQFIEEKRLNMCSRWTPQQISFYQTMSLHLNINSTFLFLSLTFFVSLFLLVTTMGHHSLLVCREVFQLYRTLKCPPAKLWISKSALGWLFCWWPWPLAAMWQGTRKKRISLQEAVLYPYHLIHQFIFDHSFTEYYLTTPRR